LPLSLAAGLEAVAEPEPVLRAEVELEREVAALVTTVVAEDEEAEDDPEGKTVASAAKISALLYVTHSDDAGTFGW